MKNLQNFNSIIDTFDVEIILCAWLTFLPSINLGALLCSVISHAQPCLRLLQPNTESKQYLLEKVLVGKLETQSQMGCQ